MPEALEVVGADALRRSLHRLAGDLQDLSSTNQTVAAQVGNAAAGRAPRRTGRLAASGRPSSTGSEAVLTFGVAHAAPQQWGVGPRRGLRGPHNIRATRFATEAAEQTQPAWMGTYTDRVQKALDHVKGA